MHTDGPNTIWIFTISAILFVFIPLVAIISTSIGFLNLLPIPVLDGGHLMFYAYEVVFGKPINQKVQEYGMQIGVSLLIALMVFVTILDISRL